MIDKKSKIGCSYMIECRFNNKNELFQNSFCVYNGSAKCDSLKCLAVVY